MRGFCVRMLVRMFNHTAVWCGAARSVMNLVAIGTWPWTCASDFARLVLLFDFDILNPSQYRYSATVVVAISASTFVAVFAASVVFESQTCEVCSSPWQFKSKFVRKILTSNPRK